MVIQSVHEQAGNYQARPPKKSEILVNENQLPQFANGPYAPITPMPGLPIAHKKQASGLLKRIMSHAKTAPKMKSKGKGKFKSSVGKSGHLSLESDQKVHFKKLHRYY